MNEPIRWFPGLAAIAGVLLVAALVRQGHVESDLAARGAEGLKAAGFDWAKPGLSGRDVILSGEAPEPALKARALEAVDRISGVRRVADTMTVLPEARPFAFQAERAGDRLVLSGAVPAGAARGQIVELAGKAHPGLTIVDELKAARGAPTDFVAAATYGIGELAKLSEGKLALSDQSLSLTGRAADFAKFDDLRARLTALPAGLTLARGLGDGDILYPLVKPFTFAAEKSAAGITLTGHVPNAAARNALLAAAAAPGAPVTDRLRIADGAPANFAAAGSYGLGELAKLSEGQLSISDLTLSLSGRASDSPKFGEVQARLAALPTGVTLGRNDVLPPLARPFLFEAEKTPAGTVLSGHVPSDAARAELVAVAGAAGSLVADRLQIADGAPPAYLQQGRFGLGELAKLSEGRLSISDTTLSLTGRAGDFAKFDEVRTRLAALPAGTQLGRGLGEGDILRPLVRPFTFSAEKSADGVTLSGYVPSEATRATLLAAARAMGGPVIDRLGVADGAPGTFGAASSFGLGELARLSAGTLSLSDSALSLSGRAADSARYAESRSRLAALPAGVTLARGEVLPPIASPFLLNAEKSAAGIVLTGHVPNEQLRAEIVAAANAAGRPVSDRLQIADGAPASFAGASRFGLGELARLGEGRLALSDSMLNLTGRAADFDSLAELRGRLAALPAGVTLGRGLGTGDIAPPIVRPFSFVAEKAGAGITLSGHVPSEAVRTALLEAARPLSGTLTDRLRVADGAPPGDWLGAGRMLLAALSKLERGRVGLDDARASIAGLGANGVSQTMVTNDLRTLPQGYQLASAQVEQGAIRPYLLNAVRGEGTLSLSGFLPSEAARKELLDHARRFFEGDTIQDSIVIGPGAPAGLLAAAKAALQELSRLMQGGAVSISDNQIALRGMALFERAREQTQTQFRNALPGGFNGSFEVTVAPAPPPIGMPQECQLLYQDALSRATIRFRTGSAELAEESSGLLDRLVIVSLRCQSVRLEIAGHTDADGADEANRELSERRAQAVAEYFVQSGIAADRLDAVGYGEARPVAPNDTPANKAKNRRIEISVK